MSCVCGNRQNNTKQNVIGAHLSPFLKTWEKGHICNVVWNIIRVGAIKDFWWDIYAWYMGPVFQKQIVPISALKIQLPMKVGIVTAFPCSLYFFIM